MRIMGAASRRTRAAVAAVLDERHVKEMEQAEAKGARDMLVKVLTHLEQKYLADDVDMTSAKGKAITSLARDLVETFGMPVSDEGDSGQDEESTDA
jgi:hypothetical protein